MGGGWESQLRRLSGFRGGGWNTVREMRGLEKGCDLWDEIFQIASAIILSLWCFVGGITCQPTAVLAHSTV